ncbi:hydrogenase expression/formation protein HypE [Aneurinibacillus uraniidurans]|uniref:hydrogenase expression/formation protein HypE n=1 Tax=Aneurinibacillus uraniidurans TaxID=2966586 RepID=UPI00234929B0|nr:hydrogenase expression/formation protein HypE [Aneurinibacillus sp. B1]WCN37433.1 hydrogenase expression/formation protein HypE [Aneurinibacillus sp. B1]
MKILLSHGDGGLLTHRLIEEVFAEAFCDEALAAKGDAATVAVGAGQLAITTDSFVIQPLEFPGGDIGKLAVAGTVNDLAVSGATPAYLSVGFILEEGLEIDLLRKMVRSLAEAAREAGVRIVAGDTKVVERGKCDRMYINTTGIGFNEQPKRLGYEQIQPGDRIIINGGIAEHGVAVLAERAGISFDPPLLSDCQPLNKLIARALTEFKTIRFMRDPTRGGVATTLKEIAVSAGVRMIVEEEKVPMQSAVKGALELMGMDPLYIANEGKVLFIVSEQESETLVDFIRAFPGFHMAAEIGRIEPGNGEVLLKTALGGTRELDMLSGTPLPRIC